LVGRDGCSNYTHLIASRHIVFFLHEWANLYKYSQQGWEAYNSLIKDEPNSRVHPLGHWIQRKLFFLFGDYLACDNI
jgi:hypothetical protein